ncbi:MAG: AAA family ATPase [Gemmatimonadota bacterium]|nr:AAA family ATPase [Gemmatimonadota bacterium]
MSSRQSAAPLPGAIAATLVTGDLAFREVVREFMAGPGAGVSLAADLDVQVARFGDEHLQRLQQSRSAVVLLDLEDAPDVGVRLAHYLVEADPHLKVIAVGQTMSAELLLDAMRAGVSEFLPKPVDLAALRTTIQRLAPKLTQAMGGLKPAHSAKVYAFFSAKGGSGSTTVATNVAIVLHRLTGKKTLLVDLDAELGEIALLLGMQPRFNFVDLVQNFHRMDTGLLSSYIERHDSGVHLLSAPYHPDRAEAVGEDQIRRIVGYLRQHYDYVVIDTSKSFSPTTLAAFEQADQVYLVSTVDLPSLRNIQRALPMLKRVTGKTDHQIRLVINRYNSSNSVTPADVERSLGLKIFATLCNDYEAVMHSINSGKPVVLNGNGAYSRDLQRLGAEIAGVDPPSTGANTRLRRALKGLARAMRRPFKRKAVEAT